MGRPALINPVRHLHTSLDEGLLAQVDLLLFSPLEGRVPKGAYQRFLTALIQRAFEHRELDLAPFVGSLPGARIVRGDAETLRELEAHLIRQGT